MNIKSKSPGDVAFRIINTTLMAIIMLLALYPCYYVLMASFSNPMDLYLSSSKILLWPKGFGTSAYEMVLTNVNIWRAYKNTIIYVCLGTVFSVFISTMGGYVLSRRYLPGRTFFTVMFTFTMFFSGGLIPTFVIVKSLGLVDTMWAMIFPNAVSTFNVIIVMTYCKSIPDSMEESAKIDGASDWRIFWNIMVPLALPTIAVITLYYLVGIWNSYIPPTMYLRKRSLLPLQVILREILILGSQDQMNLGSVGTDMGELNAYKEAIKYATIIVSVVPVLCVYPFLQRFFIKGIMVGAVKG